MATKYSDYIEIRGSRPAYVIGREEQGEWETFIPNAQFNEILRKVVSAVRNNDQDAHKSFWMDGTYGTGKSHAAAVIMHLLCDNIDTLTDYINTEYGATKYDLLRQSIFDLRQAKRLFPVNLYGTESIARKEDFSPRLQSSIKKALKDAGLTGFDVKTDFDDLANHVEHESALWEDIIEHSNVLKAYAPDVRTLANKLHSCDTGILSKARLALNERRIDIRLDSANICDWFFEIQDKLAETTDYSGLLIVWDEFTDLMKSDIGPSLLVELQRITERAMETRNNSYFFFISHPSALNKLDAQERTKTTGRYHYMKYNMEQVSAFKIMSRKFKIVDNEGYERVSTHFFNKIPGVLGRYAKDTNNQEDTIKDLSHLFPLHPATANLATYYARVVGSSSRSVFEFIGDNPAIRNFLDNEDYFFKRQIITADYLWDYVLEVFNEDHLHYGAVTERFNSYKLQVQTQGEEAFAVFKGILLLNALNNVANHESVTPTEENIKSLFVGTSIANNIDDILNWFNENSVIQRAPGGLYSIQFSALPPKEIEEIKLVVKSQFKFTSQILNYGQEVKKFFDSITTNASRPLCIKFFSLDTNDPILLHKIESEMEKCKGYELFLAMMLGRTEEEITEMKIIAKNASINERFTNTVFLVFDSPFGDDNYERFIEYMANAQCAQKHNLPDQQQAHLKNAQAMISDWMKDVRRNNFKAYIKGNMENFATMKMTQAINSVFSPTIFNKGVETLELLRTRAPKTFWKVQQTKETARSFLLNNTLDEILSKAIGQASPLKYLMQDAVDENLKWKDDIDEKHPLYLVSVYVSNKIKHADKSRDFNLAEKFVELSKPPYGLFPSYAGIASLAFAMRPWVGKIFSTDGKPRLAQHLGDDVLEIFKSWENEYPSNKVTFTFETKEAGQLCKLLINTFKLKQLKVYSDISSLKDARWAIQHEYSTEKGYPLWALKYANYVDDSQKRLIDSISLVVSDSNINKNPSLMVDVIDQLNHLEFEFRMLLNREDAFEQGYYNFLKSNENVALEDSQIESAALFIKQHLQGDVGLWKESEVTDKLKDWKISQTQSQMSETLSYPSSQRYTNPNIPATPMSGEPFVTKKKTDAQNRINNISTLQEARNLLSRLCDLGYEEILDIIIN